MKKSSSACIWGFALIVVGLLYLGSNLDLWHFNLFFDGWWTLFIIIPCIVSLFKSDEIMPSLLGIIFGILLLLASQSYIEWLMVGQIFIPFLIICIGLSLLIKPSFKPFTKRKGKGNEYLGIFGGCDEKVTEKFSGATCVAVFGGVAIDLRDAKIEDGAVIDVVSVFGGSEIIFPKGVTVKTSGVSIFGGADNIFKDQKPDKKAPTVHVNHVTIFGGTELR